MYRGGGTHKFSNDRNDTNQKNNNYNNNRGNQKYNQAQEPKTSFGSGMTSQQRYHLIVQNVKLDLAGKSSANLSQNDKGCQMHPKLSKKCRKCLQIQSSAQTKLQKQKYVLIEKIPDQIKLNNENPKSHLNQKLITNIASSQKYQNLRQLKSVKETVHELTPEQIPLQAYRRGTTQDPTFFAVFLYRLMQLKPTKPQLTIMLRDKNVNIKALALLYIRMAFDYDLIYAYLSNSFDDDHLINAEFTVGQYARKLLIQSELDNSGIRLPRIPTRIQKQINQKLQKANTITNTNMEHNFSANNNNNFSNMQRNTQVLIENTIPILENIAEKRRRSRDGKESSGSSCSSSSRSSSGSSSPDSFGSSSSSSGSSEGESKSKINKVTTKQPPRPKGPPPKQKQQSISLQNLKQRIKARQDAVIMQQRRQSLLSKYQAQNSLKLNEQPQAGQVSQESQSVQKYQIRK